VSSEASFGRPLLRDTFPNNLDFVFVVIS